MAALVYVTAFQPDAGETTMKLIQQMPAATTGIKPTSDGYLYLDPAFFPADFAADMPKAKAKFMAGSQVLTVAAAFTTPISTPAWKSKPSWALVASDDRTINPELERWMAKRANSKVTEVKASHAAYISHPKDVAKLIEQAAESSLASQ